MLNRSASARARRQARLSAVASHGPPSSDAGLAEPWPLALVGSLLVLSWLAFSWPWLSGAVTIPWDAKAHFLPQIQFMAASIARGELPFWSPNVFAGQVQIADPQSFLFSPPMLLLALLDAAPGPRVADVAVLLSVLAGGAGVVLLARELGWHWAGALVAALCFMFGAAMAWRIQHFGQVLSLCYLPFALLLLRRALERVSAVQGALAGVMAAFIALGRDQVGLLCLYVLAAYAAWHWAIAPDFLASLRGSLKPLAAASAAALLIAGLPILLTILLAAHSNRPSIDFIGAGRGSLHPALLTTAVIPHLFGAAGPMEDYWGPPSFTWTGTDLFTAQNVGQLYIGALPVLVLAGGLASGALWKREIRFFTLAAAATLLYALGWYTPFFRIAYELAPGISLYRRPADGVFLIGAFSGLLAGYAVHLMLTRRLEYRRRSMLAAAALLAGAFLLALGLAYRFDRLAAAGVPILLAAGSFALAALALGAALRLVPHRPRLAGVLLVAALTGDLALNNGPNGATAIAPSAVEMLDPATRNETIALLERKTSETHSEQRRDRVELAGLGFHWPNATMTHGLEQTLGYNPLRLRLYSEATGAGDTAGLPDQRTFTPLMPSYRSPLADLLGLRFIATGVPIEQIDPRLAPGDMTLLARTRDGFVYENPRALARVFYAHAAIESNFAEMLATGHWPQADLATTVLLERSYPALPRRGGSARIISYTNTRITVEADGPDGGWVVLNDVWHPWWFAEIDGRPAELLRANVLFRAVEVPQGRHRVTFEFRPLAGAWAELRTALARGVAKIWH